MIGFFVVRSFPFASNLPEIKLNRIGKSDYDIVNRYKDYRLRSKMRLDVYDTYVDGEDADFDPWLIASIMIPQGRQAGW